MSEHEDESPARDATTTHEADVPPGIPAEIVGNTNDLVSRDWTADAGETPDEVVEHEHEHAREHGRAPENEG